MNRTHLSLTFLLIFLTGCNAIHDTNPPPAPVEPNFKSVSSNIFINKCVGCHGPNKKESGIDLSTYEKVLSNDVFPPLVVPGKPEESSLYKSVAKGEMPKDAPPLSKRELKAIYDWIKNGAKKEEDTPKNPNENEPGEEPGEEPGNDEPGTDEPGNDEPGTNEPGTDEPGTNEPGNDEPGLNEINNDNNEPA